jgi:RNA polymerase sigma-70 factor (ECF subfamily)
MFEYEDELIAGIIEESDTAFRVAISQYQVSMLYLATSLVGQKIADEVVQEAWFSSLKAINKFEKLSSLKIWLLENEVS